MVTVLVSSHSVKQLQIVSTSGQGVRIDCSPFCSCLMQVILHLILEG